MHRRIRAQLSISKTIIMQGRGIVYRSVQNGIIQAARDARNCCNSRIYVNGYVNDR